jgi:hypothetical protein
MLGLSWNMEVSFAQSDGWNFARENKFKDPFAQKNSFNEEEQGSLRGGGITPPEVEEDDIAQGEGDLPLGNAVPFLVGLTLIYGVFLLKNKVHNNQKKTLMKKIIFLICITAFAGLSNINAQTVIIADFDTSFPISHSIVTNVGALASSGSTAIEAAPGRADNALHATYGGYEQNLQLNVALPQDKILSDYESIALEIYYPVAGDNRYKDVKYSINNGTKTKIDATGGDLGQWKTLTIPLNVAGDNSFTFEIGYNAASGGNFYIDNFQLKEKGEGGEGGSIPEASSVFENFEDKTIGSVYDMKRWYPEDGSATISVDPANPDEKSVRITTSNWDAFLKMDFVLPSEKTLADYETFSFDIYIPANSNDEYPNYKNMFVYLDDVKKHEESDYPQQAEIAVWTTKTFNFDNLSLTDSEKAKNSFALAFGLSTDKGDYYIDNAKLTEKAETGINEALSGNESLDWTKATNIRIYNLNGQLLKSSIFPTFALAGGLYIIKAEVGGKPVVTKMIIKK